MQAQTDLSTRQALQRQLDGVLPDAANRSEFRRPAMPTMIFWSWSVVPCLFNGWVSLGRADRWPDKGDYSAMDIAGEPVIVVRNKSGS